MQHPLLPIFLASFLKICAGGEWCYQTQWSCENKCNGPALWNHAGQACAGKAQSPINIVTRKTVPDPLLVPFEFTNYQTGFKSSIKNNGHSAKVEITSNAAVSGGDLEGAYKAVQFHLHWGNKGGPGSEHTLDGEQYPMEIHFVHMKSIYDSLNDALKDPAGVAVLGFFYEVSSTVNRKYEPIIEALKSIQATDTTTNFGPISLDQLIPPHHNLTTYYRYRGSLTTPPCSESVVWTVFEHPIPLSRAQLEAFSDLKFHNGDPMVESFRPVQPLNGRRVYRAGGLGSGAAGVVVNIALMLTSVSMVMGLSQPN